MSAMTRIPERLIALEGASNFRDLGGRRTSDGRSVRWRLLFRADRLSALSGDDDVRLADLGLAHVVDFRGPNEQAAAPDRVADATWHNAGIQPTLFADVRAHLAGGDVLTAEVMAGMMQGIYRKFIREDGAQFAKLFALLLRGDGPLVFHCTAGKDRTGVAAALVLLALGVPRAQVLEDYLLTNQNYRVPADEQGDFALESGAAEALWTAAPSYLQAAFDVMDTEWGGVLRYLDDQLGVGTAERTELAGRYLV